MAAELLAGKLLGENPAANQSSYKQPPKDRQSYNPGKYVYKQYDFITKRLSALRATAYCCVLSRQVLGHRNSPSLYK